jgi:hypothetical protein
LCVRCLARKAHQETPKGTPPGGRAGNTATAREIAGNRVVVSMTLLAGATSFVIGNAFRADAGFAADLSHGDADVITARCSLPCGRSAYGRQDPREPRSSAGGARTPSAW